MPMRNDRLSPLHFEPVWEGNNKKVIVLEESAFDHVVRGE